MQRQHLAILILSLLTFAASGCVPATYVQLPALHGRVVDPDGRPVGGAVVQVVRNSDQAEVATISASTDGTFSRREQSTFCFQFAGADRTLTNYSITAAAGGRRSPTTQVSDGVRRWFLGYYGSPLDRDLNVLQLR